MGLLDLTMRVAAMATLTNLVLLFLSYWVIWVVYSVFFHPLSKIPGPFPATISRAWLPWQILRGDFEFTQRAYHAKHGPLMRIAPNEITCSDPEAIKLVYPTKDPWQKSDFYWAWVNHSVNPQPDHFTGTDEKLHATRRRNVNNVYSLSNVLQSEEYIDQCSNMFVQRMGEFADAGKTVDFGEWLQMYAFDVIGELYFGRMFGFMEKSHDHASYIRSLDTLVPIIVISATSAPYARPFIMGSSIISSAVRTAISATEHIANAARTCVAQRFEEMKAGKEMRRDLLAQLIDIQREKGEKVVTLKDLEQECHIALFAGSDTTAIAMRSLFYNLLKNPSAYKKLQKELDDAAAKGELGSPVKYAEAIKLPYLCACIKEAMRVHPSVGHPLPRNVPEGGCVISGQFIPAGYIVGLNGAVIHFNKEIFGQDADEFNPSRWIDGDAVTMDKYMLHFGAGTRTCIGKNISLSELHKLVPQVLRHFTIELAEPNKSWKTMNTWFNKQTEINVKLKRR